MRLLDLSHDVILAILGTIYEPPSRNTSIRLVEKGSPYFWTLADNKSIYALALVCKALATYTYPLRQQFVLKPGPNGKGLLFFLELYLSRSLRQSVRYLTVHDDMDIITNISFPSPLPNLFALDISVPTIDSKVLTCIASCVNLRHLTVRGSHMEPETVPALNHLQRWSLYLEYTDNQPEVPEVPLPILDILLGESENSLREMAISIENFPLWKLNALLIPLRSLNSLSFVENVKESNEFDLTMLSCVPTLETLAVRLNKIDIADPFEPGSWPNLKRVYIAYSTRPRNLLFYEEKLLFKAPLLSEAFLQDVHPETFLGLCHGFSLHGPSNIRILTIELFNPFSKTILTYENIRNLALGLGQLEVFSLHGFRSKSSEQPSILFENANTNDLAKCMAGFRSLRILDWSVQIPSREDFDPYYLLLGIMISILPLFAQPRPTGDFLSPEWIAIAKNRPRYKNAIVSIANACPHLEKVKWAISGEVCWAAENFVRKDDETISTVDVLLSDYESRSSASFKVFTTML